jgi:hypothetical protein
MTKLYLGAFQVYWSSLPVLLSLAALIEALIWLFQPAHPDVLAWVPHLLIIYQFHRHYLFGEHVFAFRQSANAKPQRFGWFMLLSTALLLVPGFIAIAAIPTHVALAMPMQQLGLLMLLTTGLFYLIALSLFGTALPALVARSGKYRLSAGLKMALGTLWRLAVGPGLVQIIVFGLLTGVDGVLLHTPAAQTEAVQFMMAIIATTLSFLPSLLGVAVLCHMYEEIIAATPGAENTKAGHA